jgi:hypothetical protein
MTGRGKVDPALRESLERGQYMIDSRAVAEAIVHSWVLEAAEPGDGSLGAEQDEVAAG